MRDIHHENQPETQPENQPDTPPETQPPKIARRMLHLILKGKMQKEYEVVLDELYREKILRHGPSKTRLWYCRQVLGFAIRCCTLRQGSVSSMRPAIADSVRPNTISSFDSISQDVRLSIRRFRRESTFTIAVALTLSIGIGSSTAIFGVLSTTMISRIPYDEAERLVIGLSTYIDAPPDYFNGVSGLDYFDFRESSNSFQNLAALWDGYSTMIVTGGEETWVARTGYATWNLFPALGVDPVVGRNFLPEEEAQAEARMILISYGLWQSRFGGTRDVLGSTLLMNGSPYTIVGVLPPDFRFLWNVDAWRLAVRPGENRRNNTYYLVGRLKPDVSIAQAQADVETISLALEHEYPDSNEKKRLRLTSLQQYLGADIRAGLILPAVVTACLLLLACVNVAGLMLVRGQRRTAEVATRSALGASRWNILRQLLTESVVFTLPAGVLGVGLAYLFQEVLLQLVPAGRLGVSQPALDAPVLLFALITSLATGLLVGIIPAIRSTAATPSPYLHNSRQLSERRSSIRLRSGLVALQFSISIVLLIFSGLVARSLSQLSGVDLGFSTEQVLSAAVRIPAAVNQEREMGQAFFPSILHQIRALPGVESAGATSRLPILNTGLTQRIRAASRPLSEGEHGEFTYVRWISPGYFSTMNMPLRRGRDILETDGHNAPAVAVISESLADKLFPDQDPVGQRAVHMSGGIDRAEVALDIVGVVGNACVNSPRVDDDPVLYLPALQSDPTWMRIVVEWMTIRYCTCRLCNPIPRGCVSSFGLTATRLRFSNRFGT